MAGGVKILVTGAAGFIGSHLAERWRAAGHEVIGADNFDDYYDPSFKRNTAAELVDQGVQMTEIDLVTGDLRPLLEGVDVVYHLAAQPGNAPGTTFATYVRNNLMATQRLVEAAGHVSAFVNISTSSVYGKVAQGDELTAPAPISNYGVTKLAAEQAVLARWRDRGFPACSCRLFSVYGERERPDKLYPLLLKALWQERPFPLFAGSLDHQRSFTYVGDIVDGLMAVWQHWDAARGEIFNLGNDDAISTGEGIGLVEQLTGRQVSYQHLPARAGDQQLTRAQIDKARRLLGYHPATAPREGLARMVKWYEQKIHGRVSYGV